MELRNFALDRIAGTRRSFVSTFDLSGHRPMVVPVEKRCLTLCAVMPY